MHMFLLQPHERTACGANLATSVVTAEPENVTCGGCKAKLVAMGWLQGSHDIGQPVLYPIADRPQH